MTARLGKRTSARTALPASGRSPYQPGSLKAVARQAGKEVASETLRSAGKPAKIILISDRDTLGTSFDEVAHV